MGAYSFRALGFHRASTLFLYHVLSGIAYKQNGTEYIYRESYSTTGNPKVERSSTAKERRQVNGQGIHQVQPINHRAIRVHRHIEVQITIAAAVIRLQNIPILLQPIE